MIVLVSVFVQNGKVYCAGNSGDYNSCTYLKPLWWESCLLIGRYGLRRQNIKLIAKFLCAAFVW